MPVDFLTSELKAAGFTIQELRAIGFTGSGLLELKSAGFSETA
jgi:hypothetical protein